MKNLSLAAKISILVTVLLITAVSIAIVGLRQRAEMTARFDRLIDQNAKAIVIAEAARVDLLQAIRAEKNAVLTSRKDHAKELADYARAEVRELTQNLDALTRLASTDPATAEGKALADINRAMDEFTKNQKEVLRLAVVKSEVEGKELLFGELHRLTQEAEDFVASLGNRNPGTAISTTRAVEAEPHTDQVAVGRELLGQLYELLYYTSLHLNAATESEMTQLDIELRARTVSLQECLWRLSALLDDNQRSRGSGVLASLESIKNTISRVQSLSHDNSDPMARELTLTRTVELVDQCDEVMSDLVNALLDRMKNDQMAVDEMSRMGVRIVATTGGLGLLVSLAMAVFITRSIVRPVSHGLKVFEGLAGGDLTQRMNLDSHDEIGRLGTASDQMAERLRETVTQIRTLAGGLSESAGDLSGVSHDLLSQSHEMAMQAETVAAGTEQLSSNISSMAAAAEQMSVNVSSISSASEEVSVNVASISASAESASRNVGSVADSMGKITTSLQDVARDAKKGSLMTEEAREMATAANQAMDKLDQAASDITKVTDVIKSIALQTNLLALNATIEATSAGEAGKGFAVVAGEIKELANQSAQSAEEIARKIESVQAHTCEAVKVIENVAKSIGEINIAAARISEAVGVQTLTAGQVSESVFLARKGVEDIARSIAEVAKGADDASGNTSEAAQAANDVSRNAAEAATASQSISSNIQGVSEAARENNASAVRIDEAARRLKDIAARLQRSVEHFKTGTNQATNNHA